MSHRTARITVFDSGIGGLSILRHLLPLYPSTKLHYFSDAAHLPYGAKDALWIEKRLIKLLTLWRAQGTEHLVIACNTATAAAAAALRKNFAPMSIIGIEPGLKPALAQTKKKKIGVLATPLTLASPKFKTLLNSLKQQDPTVVWTLIAADEWVEAIENHSIYTRPDLIAKYCTPLLQHDVVVLGCTHYNFIKPHIKAFLGYGVTLIDTAQAVTKHVARIIPSTFSPLDEAPNNDVPSLQGVCLESSDPESDIAAAAQYFLTRTE